MIVSKLPKKCGKKIIQTTERISLSGDNYLARCYYHSIIGDYQYMWSIIDFDVSHDVVDIISYAKGYDTSGGIQQLVFSQNSTKEYKDQYLMKLGGKSLRIYTCVYYSNASSSGLLSVCNCNNKNKYCRCYF